MKHLLTVLIILFTYYSYSKQVSTTEYNPLRLIVKFNNSSEIFMNIREINLYDHSDRIEIQEVINKPELISFFNEYKIFSIKPAKLLRTETIVPDDVNRIYFFDFMSNEDLENAFSDLLLSQELEYVEYDWILRTDGREASTYFVNPENLTPNDPGFNNQWGLMNTGQIIGGVAGLPGADINITPAWDFSTGSESSIISVLDTGMPLSAVEFSGRILPGYDFANNDNDPTDDHGHGTNVASILAAKGNNSIGIAGIDWNCKIIPIKILNSDGFGSYSWFISGIIMAADSGAKVLNMSVGGSSFSQGLQDAVIYAQNSGSIIVACMMNENNEVTFYPAGFNNVISVGALNNIDRRAVPFCWGGGSNYGNHIDFIAPGDMILGLNYLNPTQTTYWCGTSQATPMVAGLISLMLGLDPSLTRAQLYDKLKHYAHDQIGNPLEDTPGWDKYYGWGRIDALGVIQSIVPVELTSFTSILVNNDVILEWTTSAETNNQGFEIQRAASMSSSVKDWAILGYVTGHGTTTEIQKYSFTDFKPEMGNYFYRLKQIDFNGTFEFSKVIEVATFPLEFSLQQNYPNPFNPITKISFNLAEDVMVTLKIFNALGEVISTLVNQNLSAGVRNIEFNASHLVSGVYFYRLEAAGKSGRTFSETRKMILLK